jgi:protein-tyrosine-phosphatase
VLLDPRERDIADPIGGPPEVYRETADQIREALVERVREWA